MAATTNIVQVNPTQTNQYNDSQYDSSALTTGGYGTGAIVPSQWLNKFCYQTSTFLAAFAKMMVNKGYTVQDVDLNNLSSVLANLLTNADQKPQLITVSYGNSVTFDNSQSNGFYLGLQGNVVSSNLINVAPGNRILFTIQQNSIGGYAFAWPSNVINPGTVDPTPNATSIQEFVIHPDNTVHPIGPMVVS